MTYTLLYEIRGSALDSLNVDMSVRKESCSLGGRGLNSNKRHFHSASGLHSPDCRIGVARTSPELKLPKRRPNVSRLFGVVVT
jgi:hypothetical protein